MRFVLLIVLLATTNGCSLLRSRYAMDDPAYARKYADGASKRDILGKIKQAIDARHTEQLAGAFMSGGVQVRPRSGEAFGSLEAGVEVYESNHFTKRLSFAGLAGDDSAALGVEVGVRLQTPSRLAPFVGVGASAGILAQDAVPIAVGITLDAVSDDDSDFVSDYLDSDDSLGGLAAVYPEVGAHFWLNGRVRFTTFGRYLVTTEGRKFDDWLVGGQIAIFSR